MACRWSRLEDPDQARTACRQVWFVFVRQPRRAYAGRCARRGCESIRCQPRVELEAVTTHVGLTDRSDRVRLEISGPDRAKFLHNLTTNEIKRLAVGRGCETFVTNPQGKTIGYLIILVADDRIIARADPGGIALALPHFQKYGVFDDVSIDDGSSSTFELHFFGPCAGVAGRTCPQVECRLRTTRT